MVEGFGSSYLKGYSEFDLRIDKLTVSWAIREHLSSVSCIINVKWIFSSPSFRNKLRGIVEVERTPAGSKDWNTDSHSSRNKNSVDVDASGWCITGMSRGRRCYNTQCLIDNSLEIFALVNINHSDFIRSGEPSSDLAC